MAYTPEELQFIARIVSDWDSETEADLLSELDAQIGLIPDELLGISTLDIKQNFDEFHTQMLRRHAALLVLRRRSIVSCDELIAAYAHEVAYVAHNLSKIFPRHLHPSVSSMATNNPGLRGNFLMLLSAINEMLRSLCIQRDPSLLSFETSPNYMQRVQGYEICTDVTLHHALYRFERMKGVAWESREPFSLADALNDLFTGLRDGIDAFLNAFRENPGAATLGTIDGILDGLGFYFLVDAVIYSLEVPVYSLLNYAEHRGWMEYTGVRSAEFGATRAYAADVFWLAVEGLGGEDVRDSAAFQDTRNVAQAVTTVVTFFQGIKSLYNLTQFIGRSASASAGLVGAMADDLADVMVGGIVGNGGSAALTLQSGRVAAAAEQWARVAATADSVPWARAAVALNAVRAGISTFSAGGAGGGNDYPRETPGGRRVSEHIFKRSSDEFQHFDPQNPEDLQQIDDIIDDPIGTFVTRQRDGAGVYIRRVGDGDWTLVIYNENNNTIVTAIRQMDFDQIVGRATNYGFDAPPRNWRIFNE